jgi:putative Mn2+ efflux pump MntP
MTFFEIVFIAVGLAMDASAVSLVAAASGYAGNPRAVFRLSFHFGLFQFFMPVIGWMLGITVARYITFVDHWIAFGLLAFVGTRMIRSGWQPSNEIPAKDPSRGLSLVMLSFATSIDAMAIGLSIAILNVSIWYPSVIIGLVTSALSLVAIRVGKRLGKAIGHRMEIIGGLILIAIGVKVLISHLIE